ncbi:MAG: hypothetical protein K2J15_03035 [Muribaculaceae bacterium]|nr:hypothetical protein [Muribaculaceae bacterium]
MKKCKVFLIIVAAVIAPMLVASCSSKQTAGENQESEAQIEAARNAGREAARLIITREFADSMEFHGAILEAASRKAPYQMDKQPGCVAAFDSAFISTIRTVRPDLARRLQ